MPYPSELQDAVTNMMDGSGMAIRACFNQPTQPPTHITAAAGKKDQAETSDQLS